MKIVLTLLFFVVGNYISLGQSDEKIKVDITNGCSSFIQKKQFKNELVSRRVELIDNMTVKVHLKYSYDVEGIMLHIYLVDNIINAYHEERSKLIIGNKEIEIGSAVIRSSEKYTKNSVEYTYYKYSIQIDNSFFEAVEKTESIDLSLVGETYKSKTISLNNGKVKEFKEFTSCFHENMLPIQRIKETSLKSYSTNFRKSKWGSSVLEVKTSEGNLQPQIEQADALYYDVRLNADEFSALYYFTDDALYQGVYLYQGEFVNKNNYYQKYLELRNILRKKYGTEVSIKKHQSDDLYNLSNEIGKAISRGYYSEAHIWETKDSIIKLLITGENFKVKITIRYLTKDNLLTTKSEKHNSEQSIEGF